MIYGGLGKGGFIRQRGLVFFLVSFASPVLRFCFMVADTRVYALASIAFRSCMKGYTLGY